MLRYPHPVKLQQWSAHELWGHANADMNDDTMIGEDSAASLLVSITICSIDGVSKCDIINMWANLKR